MPQPPRRKRRCLRRFPARPSTPKSRRKRTSPEAAVGLTHAFVPMFDVGFSEIVVIAIVALIVIGPERLPKAARTLGHLFGRLQRYVNDVKADINREMQLDELKKLQQEVKQAASEIETSVSAA